MPSDKYLYHIAKEISTEFLKSWRAFQNHTNELTKFHLVIMQREQSHVPKLADANEKINCMLR